MSTKAPSCIGFGDTKGACGNPASYPAGAQRPYWCRGCEQARRDHIDRWFEQLLSPAAAAGADEREE